MGCGGAAQPEKRQQRKEPSKNNKLLVDFFIMQLSFHVRLS